MRGRLVGSLVVFSLACQSDPPVTPNAVGPASRRLATARSLQTNGAPIVLLSPAIPTPSPTSLPLATPTPTAAISPTATPTPAPATATPVATATPIATPTATPAPRPTATPTPRPSVAASDPECLDLATVPSQAVPIFTGRSCRTSEGFLPIRDPATGAEGCVRNWRCADGDQRFQPVVRIGASLNGGGPDGVHRCHVGEGMGPEYICDAGRAGQEAYGRNITDSGGIIEPPREPNGYLPGPWERAGICAPVLCR